MNSNYLKPPGKFRSAQIISLLVIYEESKQQAFKDAIEAWDTEIWVEAQQLYKDIPKEFHNLPNYIAAQEIKNSPLYETMREKDGTEPSSEEET